jgi:rhodanese-related sulfurtransferase
VNRYLVAGLIGLSIFNSVWAYDTQIAKNYEKFFAAYADKNLPKALGMITAEDLVKMIKSGEEIWVLDIRTPVETSIVGMSYKNTLNIPMSEVFKPENLAKIPADKKVVVACQKGPRATAVALALRNIGFNNVVILKGGLVDLINYLEPKTAYQ